MTIDTAPLVIAFAAAALTLLPQAGWTERVCAAAILLPAAIGLLDLDSVSAVLAFRPSLFLSMTLEMACLLLLLHACFSADRWFPLVMAAAATIGLVARGLTFSGLGGPHLNLLQMSSLPLLTMAAALLTGMAVKVVSQSLSNASA